MFSCVNMLPQNPGKLKCSKKREWEKLSNAAEHSASGKLKLDLVLSKFRPLWTLIKQASKQKHRSRICSSLKIPSLQNGHVLTVLQDF